MGEVGRIRSRFELEIAGFQRSITRMQRSLDRVQGDLQQTGRVGTRSFNTIERSASGLAATFRSAARASVILSTALGGLQLGRTAIQLENVSSTLRFLTGSQENAAGAFERVSRLADELGANVLDLAESYVQLAGATRGADFSQAEVEDLFRALTIAARALGRSNAELRLAFIGLSQALGSSNVQLQEIRQITEALPGTLSIMAQALGKTTGEFRDFIATGRATPREVFLPFARAANETFLPAVAEMDRRVTTSFNRMLNAIVNFVNAIVRTGILDLAAAAINKIAQGINAITTAAQAAIRALTNLTRRLRGLPPIPRVIIDIPAPSRTRPGRPGFPAVSGPEQSAQVGAFRAEQERIAEESFQLQLMFDRDTAAMMRANEQRAQSFRVSSSIIRTALETVGATFAQLTIGVLRGTQTMENALQSLAESLAAAFANRAIQVLINLALDALSNTGGGGVGAGAGSLIGSQITGGGQSSGGGGVFGGPGGGLGSGTRGISIINVPNQDAAAGAAAQERVIGRQVIINTMTEEFARGNVSPVVRVARQTLGR